MFQSIPNSDANRTTFNPQNQANPPAARQSERESEQTSPAKLVWPKPDTDQSKQRRKDSVGHRAMFRTMARVKGLGKRDADTYFSISDLNSKPDAPPGTPYSAKQATIGFKLLEKERESGPEGKRTYDTAVKLAQRRSYKLFNQTQPTINRQFITRLPDGDGYIYIDHALAVADWAAQAFEDEGKKSPEWLAAIKERDRKTRAQKTSAIYESYALAALELLPPCDARLITPDGELSCFVSCEQAKQFCADNEGWHWATVEELRTVAAAAEEEKANSKRMTSDDLEKFLDDLANAVESDADQIKNAFDYQVARLWLEKAVKTIERKANSWIKVEGALDRAPNRFPPPPGDALPAEPEEEREREREEGSGYTVGQSENDFDPNAQIEEVFDCAEAQKYGHFVHTPETPDADNPNGSLELAINAQFKTPEALRDNPRFAWAKLYAQTGWAVLPNHNLTADGACTCKLGAECDTKGKHPRVAGGAHAATRDLPKLATWLTKIDRRTGHDWGRSNLGIATGKVSGFLTLDLDTAAGMALYEDWKAKGWIPDTREADTQSGTRHVLFNYFPGLKNGVKPIPGLDIRTDGGQIVVEPSVGPKGVWRWRNWSTPIAEAPAELKEYLLKIAPAAVEEPTVDEAAEATADAVESAAPAVAATPKRKAMRPADLVEVEEGAADLGNQTIFYKDYPDGERGCSFFEIACALRGKLAASYQQILRELRHRNGRVQTMKVDDARLCQIASSVVKRYPAERRTMAQGGAQ